MADHAAITSRRVARSYGQVVRPDDEQCPLTAGLRHETTDNGLTPVMIAWRNSNGMMSRATSPAATLVPSHLTVPVSCGGLRLRTCSEGQLGELGRMRRDFAAVWRTPLGYPIPLRQARLVIWSDHNSRHGSGFQRRGNHMTEFTDVTYEVDNGLAWITINRPDRYNAFRARTLDELIRHVPEFGAYRGN